MARKNCWEVKGCGREYAGIRAENLGICPAARPDRWDGANRGERGGRFCWGIAGTCAHKTVAKTFTDKILDCLDCGFLQQVRDEEGGEFILTAADVENGMIRGESRALESTAVVAKRTLLFMANHAIPVTPPNYTLWYEYHLGGHADLERDVNKQRAEGMPLDAELTERLYRRYFGNQDSTGIMDLVEEQAGKILKESIENILATVGNTTAYGKKLQRYSRTLKEIENGQELKHIIQNIISDTREVEAANTGLRKRLMNIAAEAGNLKQQVEQKEKDLLRDPLTGIGNRRALTQSLQKLSDDFIKKGAVFSVIMCNVNSFKQFNEQYGRMIGDEALQIVSATLQANTKGENVLGRYGGDKFMLLLPMTSLYGASITANHLIKAVAEKKLKLKKTGSQIDSLTISAGVAQMHDGDSMESILKRADETMSLAKRTKSGSVKSEQDLRAE